MFIEADTKSTHDPIKQILRCNDTSLSNFALFGGKLSETSVDFILKSELQTLWLYDVMLDRRSTKEKLRYLIRDSMQLTKIKIVSRITRNSNPFFRELAIHFIGSFLIEQINLKSLSFTLNQEYEMNMNPSFFPNLKRLTVYYSTIYSGNSIIQLLHNIRITKLPSLHKIRFIEYLEKDVLTPEDLFECIRKSQ